MTFQLLMARAPSDPADHLYPQPGAEPNSFVPEPEDGRVIRYSADGAIILDTTGTQARELGRVERIEAAITVTQSRFVFACSSFQSGSQWRGGGVGGVLVAAAANAASKAIANRGTRGYTLVGHVRYDWLLAVTAQDRIWRREQNHFKLLFTNPAGPGTLLLSVFPPNRHPAETIAGELVRIAARAKAQAADGELRTRLEAYATRPPIEKLKTETGETRFFPSRHGSRDASIPA